MLHDDLKWENSLDNFCLEHGLQGEKKEHLISIYGKVVFDILQSRIYHEFIKKSLWEFFQDSEADLHKLSTHIHNLYHEDLFHPPLVVDGDAVSVIDILHDSNFAFKAVGDGIEVEKFSLATHKNDLAGALENKKKIVCMFKVPDNLRGFKEMLLGELHKDTKMYRAMENKVPSSFHVDWEKQDDIYKVTHSPFIR